MNNGFYWTEQSLQDLMALSKDDFLQRYEKVSEDAYRQRKARELKRIEDHAPIKVEDQSYTPSDWNYMPRSPLVPSGIQKHVNIGDTHGYYVDQPVWASVLDFIRDFKPDQINCLGDMVDFYDVSRYTKDPLRKLHFQQEIDFSRDVIFAELRRAAPKATIYWKKGNHEDRLQNYLRSRAPELASLRALDIDNLFDLRKLKIGLVDSGESLSVGDIELTHGHLVRKHSGMTAKAMMDDWGTSVVHNHTHRLGAIYKTDKSGEYVAFENGCLCIKDMEYIHGVPNWQTGFSYGWVLPSGRFHLEQVAVLNGKFVAGGKFFGSTDKVVDCHD